VRLCSMAICWVLVACAGRAWGREPDWEAMRGLPIVAIDIDAAEVFDPRRPGENLFLFNWVNALHIRTRESVIRREFLFAVGEPFDPLRCDESERNLRGLGIFQDARIEVQAVEGGVRLLVLTSDRWSMRLVTDLSKEGDIYRVRLGLENINFLGRGGLFGGNVVASNDVDAAQIFFAERRLFGSRWQTGYGYGSDGLVVVNDANLGRPYFSELVHWTSDLNYRTVRGERRVFYDDAMVDSLDLDETVAEAFGAGHAHGPTRTRFGLLYSQRGLNRAIEAQQSALGVCWGALQRRYRQVQNVDRYSTSEDISAGWSVQVGLGADLEALGADANRPLWRADATIATFLGEHGLVGLQVRHHAFAGDQAVENGRVQSVLYGFWQPIAAQTLCWNVGFSALLREPESMRFVLGGDNSLRGYPARFDTGTRVFHANLEHRLFTPVRVAFLGLGAALFVDAGQAWEANEPFTLGGTHVGGGAGIRIGNRKSGTSIFRIDFAFGRNSYEVSLSSGSFFGAARDFEFPDPSLIR